MSESEVAQVVARFRLAEMREGVGYYKPTPESDHTATPGVSVTLNAVQGEPFGSATPSGQIQMFIANPTASAFFIDAKIGAEFDLLFTRHQE